MQPNINSMTGKPNRGRIGKYSDLRSVHRMNQEDTYLDGTGEGFTFDDVYYKTHPIYRNVGVSSTGAINRRPTKGKNTTRHNPITKPYITTYSTGSNVPIPRDRVVSGVWGESYYASSYGLVVTRGAHYKHPRFDVYAGSNCRVFYAPDTEQPDQFEEIIPDDRGRLPLPDRPTWRTVVWEAYHCSDLPEGHIVVNSSNEPQNSAEWLVAVPVEVQRAHARQWDHVKFAGLWVQEPTSIRAVRNVPIAYLCLTRRWSPWMVLETCMPAREFIDFGLQHIDSARLDENYERCRKLLAL